MIDVPATNTASPLPISQHIPSSYMDAPHKHCPAESKVQGLLWVNPSMEPPVLKVVLGEQCLSKKVTSFWSESKAPRTETNH